MLEMTYTGWKKWYPTADEWLTLYNEGKVLFELKENQYLIVKSDDGSSIFYCYENGQLRKFTGGSFKTFKETSLASLDDTKYEEDKKSATKKFSKGKNVTITPRNEEQVCAFDLMKDDSKTIKLLTGTYGSGKTMLVVNAALEMLSQGKVDKIVWLRNAVGVKDAGRIGYLPGSEFDKLKPFIMPLVDHLGSEQRVVKLIEHGQLEVPALEFIRGRNIENAAIICTEAQNLTEDMVKLIIGRVAKGSYLFFDGDFRQYDRISFEKSPGIKRMIECLAGEKLFGYVHMSVSERSETAKLADKFSDTADEKNR